MEGGLPMLNCLLQQSLRSLCTCTADSSDPSAKWVYAIFWRILPRNYPPPKWDHGGGALDRAKGNKRNWILVWEDGFCDFYECERSGSGYIKGRFGADVFFKMSHEVYNYGEGLVGKVAADNCHKWVFSDTPNETDPSFTSSWNATFEPSISMSSSQRPKAWEFQFNSGIQTIAIISVREGIIQLGSLDKIVEDLNLVISIQRKFSYLQSIPGIYAMQRPYLPNQHPYIFKHNNNHKMIESNEAAFSAGDKSQLAGFKRLYGERLNDQSPIKSMNFSFNSPQNGIVGSQPPLWSIPPLLPSIPCNYGGLSKFLCVAPSYNGLGAFDKNKNSTIKSGSQNELIMEAQNGDVKTYPSYVVEAAQQENPGSVIPNPGIKDAVGIRFGGPVSEAESTLNVN